MEISARYITITYDAGDKFIIDIQIDTQTNVAEAWLQQTSYGIKELMFGSDLSKNKETIEEFIELVDNLAEDYKKDYLEKRDREI